MTSAPPLTRHQERMASNFRSLINDLKRRPEDAAKDLEITVEEVEIILSGRAEITQEIIEKALEVWPISPRDFFLIKDDCPDGVKIMRSETSKNSARVMSRAGRDYYDYRDTAMSSVAAFRPEWIRELCVVDDNSAENSEVQWNNGHFLHQFTYFIGPVNFYYRDEKGNKKIAVMNTGDSMYISPFVPHSFTTRKNEEGEFGLILALTYANKLGGEAQQELSLFGPEQASNLMLDYSSEIRASGDLVRFHREALSMPINILAELLGKEVASIESLENGAGGASFEFLQQVAEVLAVPVRELLSVGAGEPPVQIRTREESRQWAFMDAAGHAVYGVVELCGSKTLPFSKALEFTIHEASMNGATWIQTGLHQYVYNLGEKPVTLRWHIGDESKEDEIGPGASFYMKPGTKHSYTSAGSQLLVLRIGGRVGGDVLQELAQIGHHHLGRVLNESMQWFDPKGRTNVSS